MRVRITGSRVDRVWHCPASAVLPQLPGDESEHEPARTRGKDIHRFLERARRPGTDPVISRAVALGEAPEDLQPLLEAVDLDDLPVQLATEVAFSWNWVKQTGREIGRNIDRAYDHPSIQPPIDWESEIPCTLDIVGTARDPDGVVRGFVSDYKTGHGKLPPPDQFGQTLLGALCVRDVYKCDDCIVELITIHDNGSHHRVRRTVSDWGLDRFSDELTLAMTAAESEDAQTSEGAWCRYCAAYRSCPAKVALVKSIPSELMAMGAKIDPDTGEMAFAPGQLSVRNAGRAWMVLERIKDVVSRAFEELRGIAWNEDIPLPDGRVVQRNATERRHADGRVAAKLLEDRYGRAERDRRVEPTVTLSSLRAAVVANIQRGEKIETRDGTGVYDRLLAELKALGGLEIKEIETVKAQAPKKR